MRLERLELSGFKSFSDRSELAFDRGVTAIVGPNGCGKSNVVDAITWVMGEQSAKSLRGERMEDVIFSGSDARRPTGAAEVRLRLSGVAFPPALPEAGNGGTPGPGHANGNGNAHAYGSHLPVVEMLEAVREVELTRRLYRSGESEYLIDGHVCRLRDIHELLMDTGLGAKAYAIIEQGKIGMILSSRATDRRQLIEEAAGITKYKARRRAAELKLEAAQQNLTRIDDIVYEVERQRGSLKRQAARARRFTRLRDEMRRWEKVLLARRYRLLAELMASTRARLAEARQQETAADARLAGVEADLSRLRLELADADAAVARAREGAHARELAVNRRQQQVALDTQQADMLETRRTEVEAERATLAWRREPERLELEERRAAALAAEGARAGAATVASTAADALEGAQRGIEAAEQAVDTARGEVYGILNTITALTAALEAAGVQRDRAADALARLDIEAADLATEHARARAARDAADTALRQAQADLAATSSERASREADLAGARLDHDRRARELRSREHALAAVHARLGSLEELDAHRAGFSDAARMLLVEANGQVGQMGALADRLEVEPRYERAVEACLGDLLQHVLVVGHEQAAAGLALVRQEDAGRCGFVVVGPVTRGAEAGALHDEDQPSPANPEPLMTGARDHGSWALPDGAVRLSGVARLSGEHEPALRDAIGEAVIVESFEMAAELAPRLAVPVATLDGDLLRGAHVVSGGSRRESRGILATKREIKELREQAANERSAIEQLAATVAVSEQAIAAAIAAIADLSAALHRHEKRMVAVEGQLQRAADDEARLTQRADLVASETARTREEIARLEARQLEARDSITRLDEQRAQAETCLAVAQRTLAESREHADTLAHRAGEARAEHAALVERCAALTADVVRLEHAAGELEQRLEACAAELASMHDQRERLLAAAADGQRLVDEDVRALRSLADEVVRADERAARLRSAAEQQEEVIRDARRAVDAVRALSAELDVARATAESDLAHLAQQSLDTVAAPLDEVCAAVEQMEAAGEIEPDVRAILAAEAPDPDEDDADGGEGIAEAAVAAPPVRMTAEDAIAALRTKIDRLGPVNMIAIEQFSELDGRHRFLIVQREDLLTSIQQTREAIQRIDVTTHERFREAFAAINANFQQTFSTLFGGGRAGLSLLDESDPLESGIDLVASPPGKRLQNVQLLSGGEKALTAIALMFAIFRYKPSPFCLLDEIDAPLDDANIGRFVEMLRGMLDHTQFIIVTHNRKTMEIADRLYGVTMEEPGVSKLISIQLN